MLRGGGGGGGYSCAALIGMVLSHFGLKTGIDYEHFGLKLGTFRRFLA